MTVPVRDGVATVVLDHPENRNALTPQLLNELGDALAEAADAHDVRVIVLTNEGPAFCAGADLSGRLSGVTARYSMVDVFGAILDSPKPVVGRIAGHCLGGGVGLAAACDLSIAADDVRIGFTEVRIGVAPAIISVICLPKLRRADALELFLAGERIDATRAAAVGLLTRAVPRQDLDAAVAAVVDQLLAGAPGALAAAKRLVHDVPGMEQATAFASMERLSAELFASAEAQAGMAAFREKRRPPWAPEAR